MKHSRRLRPAVLLLLLGATLAAAPHPLAAQTPEGAKLAAVLQETQKLASENEKLIFAWWMPEGYWRMSFEQNEKVTKAASDELLKTLRPYVVIGVVSGRMGPVGGLTYRSESEIRQDLVLVDTAGVAHKPLEEAQVSSDAKNFLGIMKPMLASMLGAMGQNMQFYLFPAQDASGRAIADPEKEGRMKLRVTGEEFEWRLPIGSLLPPKVCPQDGEKLNGAWTYCPWHGVKLVAAPAEAPAAPAAATVPEKKTPPPPKG
jgi:hypothetical protein